jgi:toxin YoeB
MIYEIEFTDKAIADIELYKKSGQVNLLKKIAALIREITETPFEGTGKPEPLKYDLRGCWSRRISKEHRLVYEVFEDYISILSAYGHYE